MRPPDLGEMLQRSVAGGCRTAPSRGGAELCSLICNAECKSRANVFVEQSLDFSCANAVGRGPVRCYCVGTHTTRSVADRERVTTVAVLSHKAKEK